MLALCASPTCALKLRSDREISRKFKNILDSTPVEIEPDVTCLVGKNESGKTAYLHALYRLRPARPNAVFNVQLQYPRLA
jgi:predicted ATP-dependent endonuclease of OLD family